MTDLDLCYLSASEAIRRFKQRTLSPVELLNAQIQRAQDVEPKFNHFTLRHFERALSQAKQAEKRYAKKSARLRPLEGITVAIKDENAIKDEVTTSGSLIYKDNIATSTSLSVERILKAGGIVHARSACPEFACAGVTHSKLWGVSRNPWNTEFTTGGSSGGAGGSLAAGTTTLANGSDIWGSIRMPASCCGVLGFKPPYGRIPEDAPFNLDTYCHEGPLARNVEDLALLQNVMAGPHPLDITTVKPKLRIPQKLASIKGWKIAYSMDLGYFEIDPEVAKNTQSTLDQLQELGAIVEPVDLGWDERVLTAASNHLGHIFGTHVADHLPANRELMTNYAREFGEFSGTTTAQGFFESLVIAGDMYKSLGPMLEKYDIFVCPTMPVAAMPADYDPGIGGASINGKPVHPIWGWCMTYPFNMMSRCPVMSVPSGFASNGVPTGVQLVARTYDDVRVFRAAAELQRIRPMYDTVERRPAV
jgi:Asp-tRNA(Asn)/Glu-tRNA(Gln) amidotransferase A subunit family amidase